MCIGLIENLPNTIEELNFGKYFNLPLDNLPNSIKSIKFNKYSEYDITLNNLPKSLEILELPFEYDIPIKNINPKCIVSKN